MRNAMEPVTDTEISDGFKFRHNGHVYIAYDIPDDNGFACGYDENGRDCDLQFVWTMMDCWVFVDANLAEHETIAEEAEISGDAA